MSRAARWNRRRRPRGFRGGTMAAGPRPFPLPRVHEIAVDSTVLWAGGLCVTVGLPPLRPWRSVGNAAQRQPLRGAQPAPLPPHHGDDRDRRRPRAGRWRGSHDPALGARSIEERSTRWNAERTGCEGTGVAHDFAMTGYARGAGGLIWAIPVHGVRLMKNA
jgi:hypothetical protein